MDGALLDSILIHRSIRSAVDEVCGPIAAAAAAYYLSSSGHAMSHGHARAPYRAVATTSTALEPWSNEHPAEGYRQTEEPLQSPVPFHPEGASGRRLAAFLA